MSGTNRTLSFLALYCVMGAVSAQPPPAAPAKTAQSEAGEPRADTSSSTAAPAPPPARVPAAKAVTPTAAGSAAAGSPGAVSAAAAPAAVASTGAAHAAAAPPVSRAPAGQAAGGGAKSPSKSDRLELGTATVTGDREQPKVMYIVPWKRSDIGDLAGKPMNSLVDEILAPVDRDVFKREVVYYGAVQAEAGQNGALPKPPPQGEK